MKGERNIYQRNIKPVLLFIFYPQVTLMFWVLCGCLPVRPRATGSPTLKSSAYMAAGARECRRDTVSFADTRILSRHRWLTKNIWLVQGPPLIQRSIGGAWFTALHQSERSPELVCKFLHRDLILFHLSSSVHLKGISQGLFSFPWQQ